MVKEASSPGESRSWLMPRMRSRVWMVTFWRVLPSTVYIWIGEVAVEYVNA